MEIIVMMKKISEEMASKEATLGKGNIYLRMLQM